MMRRLASYARSANEKLNKDAFEAADEDTENILQRIEVIREM